MIVGLFYLLYNCFEVCASNYDYIVVGSGSAGSVVANRLSEDPSIKVLLLEAGCEPNLLSEIPLYTENERVSSISWNYTTVPLKYAGFGLNDRVALVPRGKVLGGTSTMNGNVYTRGNRNDFNCWAAQGAVGWDWEGVFPYFLKHEDNGNPHIATNGYHSVGGEQPINCSPFYSPITEAYLKSAECLGYARGDFNGRNQTVFMPPQATISKGRRWSGLRSFLEPIRGRRNIRILTSAHVTRILIDENNRAFGVEYDRNNKRCKAFANEEIILSAGVFNSAQLLMLSGIGPRCDLEKFNIPVISDLPVGKNLQDHPTTFGQLFRADTFTYRDGRITKNDYNEYLSQGTGPLSSVVGIEALGFIKTKYAQWEFPDVEIFWRTLSLTQSEEELRRNININRAMWKALEPYSGLDTIQCFPYVLVPKSIGEMWLASANPYDPPIIDPKYYSHPHDIKVIVEGMKFCLDMAVQEPLRRKGVEPIPVEVPGCESYPPFSEDYLACVAKVSIVSLDHFVGTCKMGDPRDPTTVVDPLLRVKGIHSLRVVDASIMPTIVSAHTHAAAAMIGEKGADLILRDLHHRRKHHKNKIHLFKVIG